MRKAQDQHHDHRHEGDREACQAGAEGGDQLGLVNDPEDVAVEQHVDGH